MQINGPGEQRGHWDCSIAEQHKHGVCQSPDPVVEAPHSLPKA
jgi:hypothetical protein